ncbi:MAG: hypothetical protein U1E73_11795 [Planctomycetota bacterium]
MKRSTWIPAALLAASNAFAQTTNVACLNDYYLTPFGGVRYPAVGTPCNPAAVLNLAGGGSVTLTVDTGFPPGSIVVWVLAVGHCSPQAGCLPSVPCPIPAGLAPCFSNQTIDLTGYFPLGPIGFTSIGACQSTWSTPFVLPNIVFGITFSTQAAILPLGVSCAGPTGFVLTEAFNFRA